ncbi:MAG TPA: DUF1990 family protein [Solirubrobacteraceae bacterium]|nr:DUF1990 family protein [Solirubrobacteraceae bacterium]
MNRLLISLRWPVGVALTSWSYIWRTTPMRRREVEGEWAADAPPQVTAPVGLDGIQRQEDGSGTYLRRRYRIAVREPSADAVEAMREIQRDPNVVAPGALAHFAKTRGDEEAMAVGDEFSVRMPGPWNGPIRVVDRTPSSFRFATLDGHIEAGQIEWRATDRDARLVFEIESWSRPGDPASDLMHHKLRMAKEVQLHMWTSVLERVAGRYGRRDGPLEIETRRVETPGA